MSLLNKTVQLGLAKLSRGAKMLFCKKKSHVNY